MRDNLIKYIKFFVIIGIIYLVGLPYLFARILPAICENISITSDYEVKIENPRLHTSIIPTTSLEADNVMVRQKETGDTLQLKNIYIKFRVLPLFTGRLHVNKFSATEFVTQTFLTEIPELDKKFIEKLKNTKMSVDSFQINKFQASFYTKEKAKPVTYYGENVFYTKNNRFLNFNFSGKITVNDNVSQATINLFIPKNNVNKTIAKVDLNNFEIAPIGDYLRQYLPKDLKKTDGIIDIHIDKSGMNADLKNLKIIMQDSSKSLIFPDLLHIDSIFSLTSKKIKFDSINIKSENINVNANGQIIDYLDKNFAKMNINIQVNKSKVEDIVNMLPPLALEDINIYKLKLYKFYGKVIGNFSVKGNYKEPEIYGNVYIKDAILTKPIPNAMGAIIKLKFGGKYLNYDVTVPAGGAEKVWVKGGVELYNVKYADMRVWSTKSVDLGIAEDKVVPIHEILNFVIGPVPIMDIKGTGNIDIIVKGNRQNPHVWGELNFFNIKTFFKDMSDFVINNADAKITFDDENVVFKMKNALANNVGVDIDGICNLAGNFNFNAGMKKQSLHYLYTAIQNSSLVDDLKDVIPNLDSASGPVNLNLKIFGTVKYIEDIKFNNNFFVNGKIELLDNILAVNGAKITKTTGVINFEGLNANLDVKSHIGQSEISVKGSLKNGFADFIVNVPKFNLIDLFDKKDKLQSDLCNILLQADVKYRGKFQPKSQDIYNGIEFDKLILNANILGYGDKNKLKVSNGNIKYKNDKLQISNLKGIFADTKSAFDINLNIDNASTKPDIDGIIQLISFDLPTLNIFREYDFIPKKIKNIRFDRGKINLNCRIKNNRASSYMDLGGIWLTYIPTNLPIKIVNGSFILQNNGLNINKLNILADDMPILMDGKINDIMGKNIFDIYINSKPKQEFVDKYINKNRIYPLKLKGDIVYSMKLKGTKNNCDIQANTQLEKDASVYHLGATIGDIENAIGVKINANILNGTEIKLKDFSYDKIIQSQGNRNTRLNMLKANGNIFLEKDDLAFDNLHIKTSNPTDARIFNIIFRKPNIKQGQFTSDLKFNGKLSNPILRGNFHIFETNIPFLDTTMKNITFIFKDSGIDITSSGEILGNDIKIKANLKNKLIPPYYVENGYLYTKVLDVNDITNKIKLSLVDEFQPLSNFEKFDITSLYIKNLHLIADKIYIRNLVAENFDANVSWSDKKMLKVNNFKFDTSNGSINGSFTNNIPKNKIDISLKANSIDANDLSYAVFDLNKQIYGNLTGDLRLSCIGTNFDNCMKTLDGTTSFNVSDGRIPKLGSLEYLLRAGNLLKGGITSLSINSVIDIITPLKTGEFSNIYGKLDIQNGIAEDISIATSGKNLSLFMSGTYNFSTAQAEMEVLGMLSKKISTMFGGIGNVSINTLFNVIPGIDLSKNSRLLENINKIPGIELSNKAYRKFVAEIQGNINGDDYVTSFKWIN